MEKQIQYTPTDYGTVIFTNFSLRDFNTNEIASALELVHGVESVTVGKYFISLDFGALFKLVEVEQDALKKVAELLNISVIDITEYNPIVGTASDSLSTTFNFSFNPSELE